ncbi:MAG: SurA N-terminal domain-containing protein [Bacillota bacterium]|nr:SurA N-terminal domain-containing protein [Bacillota bacterium]
MKRKIILLVTLLLMLLVVGCNKDEAGDNVIAKVNGEAVTQEEFDERFALVKLNYETQSNTTLDEEKDQEIVQNIKDVAYDNLVVQKLLQQDAEKRGIEIDQAEVDGNLDYIKEMKNKESEDGFEQFLKELNFSEETLRKELEMVQLTNNLGEEVGTDIEVGDEEAMNFYEENKAQFEQPGGVQIFHILVEEKETADEVFAKVKDGGDFAALAKEYSLDGSKDSGGYIGLANEASPWVTEFKEATLSLEPDQLYQEPVQSKFGYHIIKAGVQQEAVTQAFEDVQDQIKQYLLQEQKNTAFNQYLEDLKSVAEIEDLRK